MREGCKWCGNKQEEGIGVIISLRGPDMEGSTTTVRKLKEGNL